jgi:O-6-methylguanine DNA methyltransferase
MIPLKIKRCLEELGATAFAEKVYAAAYSIPPGQTRSYGWVAKKIGRPGAARAVGRALKRNPLPVVIPCHRVIREDGGIGGFNKGVSMKKRLLKKELSALLMVIVAVVLSVNIAFANPDYIIWNGPSDRKVVALTFDDGPSITGSPAILDILYKEGVKATFFVVGSEAELYPDLVFRIYDYGHDVGNHFHSNKRLKDIPFNEAISGMDMTSGVIKKITGEQSKLFRPPGGKCPDYLVKPIHNRGMKIIGWTINAEDYTEFSESFEIEKDYADAAEKLKEKVLEEAVPGAIVLLHNGSKQTIMALPDIIKELRKNGYGFVTISELLEGGV